MHNETLEDSPLGLVHILQSASQRFWEKDIVINAAGHFDFYGSGHAAEDTLKDILGKFNLSAKDLYPILIPQTSIKPLDIVGLRDSIDSDLQGVNDWESLIEQFLATVCRMIITEELNQLSEVREENERRSQVAGNYEFGESV